VEAQVLRCREREWGFGGHKRPEYYADLYGDNPIFINCLCSLHDPIGTDKEGNEITLIDILGTESDDVADKSTAQDREEQDL
jgi:hypothetical protein